MKISISLPMTRVVPTPSRRLAPPAAHASFKHPDVPDYHGDLISFSREQTSQGITKLFDQSTGKHIGFLSGQSADQEIALLARLKSAHAAQPIPASLAAKARHDEEQKALEGALYILLWHSAGHSPKHNAV